MKKTVSFRSRVILEGLMTLFPDMSPCTERFYAHHHSKTMTDLDLLKQFSEARGISGHEDDIRSLLVGQLGDAGTFSADRNGSVVCTHGTQGPRIMLAAHMDEIGFLVQHINADGFIYIVPVGGWWTHTLLSQRVVVTTRDGRTIRGVTGSKPPHFLPESERRNLMPVESMFIDVGASSKEQVEQELGIHLGDPVTPDVSFTPLADPNRVMGKAFDNRAGVAVMVEATRILHREGHPNILQSTGTVQEEVGTRGAKTIAASTHPDCAIILEAPPADDTPGFVKADAQGALGSGVQIRLFDPTAITNPRLAALAEQTALEQDIPYQLTVRRSGGTDAGALHLAEAGIPCIVLGVPTRYIHAHHGILDVRDYEAAVRLCVALVKKLDQPTVDSLVRYL